MTGGFLQLIGLPRRGNRPQETQFLVNTFRKIFFVKSQLWEKEKNSESILKS